MVASSEEIQRQLDKRLTIGRSSRGALRRPVRAYKGTSSRYTLRRGILMLMGDAAVAAFQLALALPRYFEHA
jgi:hypothetical protein